MSLEQESSPYESPRNLPRWKDPKWLIDETWDSLRDTDLSQYEPQQSELRAQFDYSEIQDPSDAQMLEMLFEIIVRVKSAPAVKLLFTCLLLDPVTCEMKMPSKALQGAVTRWLNTLREIHEEKNLPPEVPLLSRLMEGASLFAVLKGFEKLMSGFHSVVYPELVYRAALHYRKGIQQLECEGKEAALQDLSTALDCYLQFLEGRSKNQTERV